MAQNNTKVTSEVGTQKIAPCLWFDDQAEDAARFYCSIFKNSKIVNTSRYGEAGREIHGRSAGTVLTVDFELDGQPFTALNGGPVFKFTPTISFMVNCPAKDEVDDLWTKLSDGGMALMPLDSYPFSERYGWVQDKYGLSWQLIFADSIPERRIVSTLMFVGDVCGKAEEAINFYASIFNDSQVGEISRYGPNQEPDREGTVVYADLTLAGQKFAAMDSAEKHAFTFNEAISFQVNCDTQEEVDYYWEKLSAVPEAEQCGWLKDRYGVSWQIVPTVLGEMLQDGGRVSDQVMEVMLQMKKIDIETLKRTYEG